MSASAMPPRRPPGPDEGLEVVVTPDGQAWVGGRSVPVPPGTDPRVAAAEFVSALARRDGHDISAVLADTGRDERRRMIFKTDGQILQSTRPWRNPGGAEQAPAPDVITGQILMHTDQPRARPGEAPPRTDLAVPRTEDTVRPPPDAGAHPRNPPGREPGFANGPGEDVDAGAIPGHRARMDPADGVGAGPGQTPDRDDDVNLTITPGPPLDVDPESVPAWPHFDITLLSDLHVVVNGVRHVIPRAAPDPRAYAVAVAAAQLRRMGLARPVRATARDPDGTVWPLLIHPSGAATEAGPPETSGDKGRRGRRRADRGALR